MKLLLDENLSYRLVPRLQGAYPGTASVHQVGLQSQPDATIWDYAAEHGFVIVSKDGDLRDLSFFRGHPPKVVWLDVGNAGNDQIANLLLQGQVLIEVFLLDPEHSFLPLNLNYLD